jgi:hypothetical protein
MFVLCNRTLAINTGTIFALDLAQMQIVPCATMSLFAQVFVMHNRYNFVVKKKRTNDTANDQYTSIREGGVISIKKESKGQSKEIQRSERSTDILVAADWTCPFISVSQLLGACIRAGCAT